MPHSSSAALPSSPQSSARALRGVVEALLGRGFHLDLRVAEPPDWQELLPCIHDMPVLFREDDGVKQAESLRVSAWYPFVELQRKRLGKEIKDLRDAGAASAAAKAVAAAMAAKSHRTPPPQEATGVETFEDDIADLEKALERTSDWSELSRYCSTKVRVVPTGRGSILKFHTVAFAMTEDGAGVDFIRLAYRKSVQVLPGLGNDRGRKERIRLLQRPDVAKYVIALAFRDAFADDGIRLSFENARMGG